MTNTLSADLVEQIAAFIENMGEAPAADWADAIRREFGVLCEMQHPPRADCDAEGWHLCAALAAALAPNSEKEANG